MKLLIVTQVMDTNHPILGFFHRWVEEFAKSFTEVHVICLQKGACSLPDNVHVYSLGKEEGESNGKYLYRFYKHFGHIFFTVRVHYVFFHMGAVFTIAAAPFSLVRKLMKTKFYWWKTHGHIGIKERLSLLFMDRVYSASENSFLINTPKKHVIGHAIDTSVFTSASSNRKGIVFAGRVMPVKRVEDVIETVAGLHAQGNTVDLRIVGPLPDDEYTKDLQNLCHTLDIAEYVEFVGGVPHSQIEQELSSARVVVSPSDTDSVDKVVLEAMSSGTPVVTTTEAFRELLSPHGLFVEKRDVQSMIEVVTTFLALPDSEYQALGVTLREAVHANHNIETLTQRIFNIQNHG